MADYRARVVIPTTAPESTGVIEQLTEAAAGRFGGYSKYTGQGGWIADNNKLIEEDHVVIEVVSCADREPLVSWIRSVAILIKDELNEDEVLATVEEIEALFL